MTPTTPTMVPSMFHHMSRGCSHVWFKTRLTFFASGDVVNAQDMFFQINAKWDFIRDNVLA